jgi:hypothetical protein
LIVDHVHLATRVLAYEQARREVEDRLRFAGTEPSNVGSAALHAMVNQHLNENRSRLVDLIEARFEPSLAELREALVRPIVTDDPRSPLSRP